MIKKNFINVQFLSFVSVGLSAAIIHWSARLILNLYYDFILSVIVSYFLALFYAFCLNFIFVFKNKKNKIIKIFKYIFINLFFFPIVFLSSINLNILFLNLNLSYHSEVAHGLSIMIPAIISFIIYKYNIFIDHER